jgi:nitrate/TMAO reductase-like tetraheme cytochrome c subunit
MRNLIAVVTRNAMGLTGFALVLAAGILLVSLLLIEALGAEGHPYLGIITYLALPFLIVLGLALMAWGIRQERRRSTEFSYPVIDLNLARTRNRLLILLLAVVAGVVVLAASTATGVEYMGDNKFCGEACHSVMAPEYTAYQRSPHARVPCVDCHVGPGTDWLVKSKLNGAWQLVSTTFNLYSRPIETPVHNLRPSKATCERCHWPEKFHGNRGKMITRFSDDEENTELKTILLMKVGGHDQAGNMEGIHWHMKPGVQVRYRADAKRETMYEVELTLEDGTVKHFSNGEPADPEAEWRTMDCIDCHNRPTHIYYSAEEAVDWALHRGTADSDLPYVRREGVKALRAGYASHEEAQAGIPAALAGFYRSEYPELARSRADDIEATGRAFSEYYVTNVFPTMNIDWNTYPDHSGHEKSPGCYRCHAGEHSTEAGETISAECSTCHTVVAWEEASPEILELIPEE